MILFLAACGNSQPSAVDKLSAWFQGKLRIYIKGFPDDEITVSKEKVSAVKRWLDS